MKFSTSLNVTPIKGYQNVYYHDNQYIPSVSVRNFESNDDNDDEIEEEEKVDTTSIEYDEQLGRIVQYETITITTPILSSARILQNKKNQKKSTSPTTITSKCNILLSKDDVDELNDKLQALLLNNTTVDDEDNRTDDNIPTKTLPSKKLKSKEVELLTMNSNNFIMDSTSKSSYFGRCSLVVYNTITKDFVEVIRSARLAFG